ncbi:MAG: hypothetical protein HWD59_01335 [Coxiellaceae bacterium]|nr:MAG: hypothetical protein HWD59_01335 [Coxiellaceae bacterium]
MKRLTVALAAIGLTASCGAFAAYPAATNPTEVSVPQLQGGFTIGGSLFYMTPSSTDGDLNYQVLTTFNPVSGNQLFNTSSTIESIDPNYSFGYGINVGYIFPGTGNDVNLSYFYFNGTGDDSEIPGANQLDLTGLAVAAAVAGVGLVPIIDFNVNDFTSSTSSTMADIINQVDLTFGQFINVGCRLSLHPFAGARFADIQRDFNTTTTLSADGDFRIGESKAVNFTENAQLSTQESSDFTGIGPLVGMDATYYIWNGIGVAGHFDTALLVGNIQDTLDTQTTAITTLSQGTAIQSFTDTAVVNVQTNNNTIVVPVIDAKLGLNWTYLFNNAHNSDMTLEVGYQVSNYFNAVEGIDGSSSDLGLNGFYANVTFRI